MITGNFDQWFLFPLYSIHVSLQVVKYPRFKYKEPSIDPYFISKVFFLEIHDNTAFICLYSSKSPRHPDRSKRRLFSTGLMKLYQLFYIDISHSVAICKHKGFIAHIRTYPFNAASSIGIGTRINQRNLERFRAGIMYLQLVI